MLLSEAFEAHLLARGEMNEARRLALAQGRFEGARTAYPWDKEYAKTLMKKARELAPISRFKGANPYYRWAVRLVALTFAERIADVRRRLLPKSAVVSGR